MKTSTTIDLIEWITENKVVIFTTKDKAANTEQIDGYAFWNMYYVEQSDSMRADYQIEYKFLNNKITFKDDNFNKIEIFYIDGELIIHLNKTNNFYSLLHILKRFDEFIKYSKITNKIKINYT